MLLLASTAAQASVPSCQPPQPLPVAERWTGQAAWQTLPAKGYRIGKIKALKKKAISHMRKLQKLPARVQSYFENEHIRYAA